MRNTATTKKTASAYDNSKTRTSRIICIPFEKGTYNSIVSDRKQFRKIIDQNIKQYPELFPSVIANGYRMKECRYSKKHDGLMLRRIEIDGLSYTVRPSFLMPYLTGYTDDVERILFLRKFTVPYWALAYVFGRDPMFYYRMEQSLGRHNLAITTVFNANNMPEHLAADEKHTRVCGDKSYVATTVGGGCILGAAVANDAGEVELTRAYGKFHDEAKKIDRHYTPTTVNTDGWKATRNAWKTLFPMTVMLRCFLHVYIKLRDGCKKKYRESFEHIAEKLWDCYNAQSKTSFSQRVRRLGEWAFNQKLPTALIRPIEKLRSNLSAFSAAYDYPGAHRTSNMLDRLMQRMDRHLFACQNFHGTKLSADLSIRGWALIYNFAPSNPRTVAKYQGMQSPAVRLNRYAFHSNWLQNLLIAGAKANHGPPK